MSKDANEELTVAECRFLREIIDSFAKPGILNRSEYNTIILLLNQCSSRMLKEGRVVSD